MQKMRMHSSGSFNEKTQLSVLKFIIQKNNNLGLKISGSLKNYLEIIEVKPDSAAFKAGLKPNDLLLCINGVQIKNEQHIHEAISKNEKFTEIEIIRKNFESEELAKKKQRRHSTNAMTIQESLIVNAGYRIGSTLSRSPVGSNLTDRVKYFEKKMEVLDDRRKLKLDRPPLTRPRSNARGVNLFNMSFPTKVQKTNANQLNSSYSANQNSNKINNTDMSRNHFYKNRSNTIDQPLRDSGSQIDINENSHIPSRPKNYKRNHLVSLSKSLEFGNMTHSKSEQSLDYLEGYLATSPKLDRLYNSGSMKSAVSVSSLFDKDTNHAIIEYKIQWEGIYEEIRKSTVSDFETKLIDFFKHFNIELSIFPINCLYRYMTYEDSLKLLFTVLLPNTESVDLNSIVNQQIITDMDEGLLPIPEVIELLKWNANSIKENHEKYNNRSLQLKNLKDQLKQKLSGYLNNEDDVARMQKQIDRLYILFLHMGSLSSTLISSVSMWKFKEIHQHMLNHPVNNTDTSQDYSKIEWIKSLNSFRGIQANVEQIIISFFNRFDPELSSIVIEEFDNFFSELLSVAICLPIYEEKLKRDQEIMKHLNKTNIS